MKIVSTEYIRQANVNIAEIQPSEIYSHDSIQIRDLAIQYVSNQLPTYTEIIKTTGSTDGTLPFTNLSRDVQISTEYNFHRATGQVTPLWYEHVVRLPYYNSSGAFTSVEKRSEASAGEKWTLLPVESEAVICENTLIIKANNIVVGSNNYHLDKGKRQLIFHNVISGTIFAYFYTMVPTIIIKDNNGNTIDSKLYLIVATKYQTYEGTSDDFATRADNKSLSAIYKISLLINKMPDPGDTWWVKYSSYDNYAVTKETECITYRQIFKYKENLPLNSDRYSYVIDKDTKVIYTHIKQYENVFIKPTLDRNAKTGLMEPIGIPKSLPWHVQISGDSFVDATTGLTYNLLDKSTRNSNRSILTARRETVTLPARNMIQTAFYPIYSRYDNKGLCQNIKLYQNGNDYTSFIQHVDDLNGKIYLRNKSPVVAYLTTIEYESAQHYDNYNYINVNPDYKFNNTNEHVIDKTIIFYMLPVDELNLELKRSVFHFTVYNDKLSSRRDEESSITAATEYINGLDGTGKSNLYIEIGEYIATVAGNVLHPIILGYMSLTNPYAAKRIEFMDIRQRGGGIKPVDNISEYIYYGLRHYLDIGHIDGYPYNFENIAIVDIPLSVLEEIKGKLRLYDAYTIRKIREDPDFDVQMQANEFITRAVRKALRAGAHITINYTEAL